MNWQTIIVAIFIVLALLYVGRNFLRKAKSFSPKAGCGSDCGCAAKGKAIK